MRIENSFIPVEGVGETTERRLWEAGVTTWDAFDGAAVGDRTTDRIRTFVDTARQRLDEGDARFFREAFPSGSHWRCYENFREDACFLDIETTGLDERRDDVTVVSCHRDGDTTTLVAGRDLTADRLARELDEAKLLVTFNGKRFDVPFLEASFDVAVDVPHVDLMYPCRRLDLSGGLKAIEREVGIGRDRRDLSGEDAVRLWRDYRRGDEGALDTLVSYNRDDTENLRTLMELVANRLDDRVFDVAAEQAP
ncbi:MAG: ribonuclease H-like domain-containing protein [Haloarculaceae archaeon]